MKKEEKVKSIYDFEWTLETVAEVSRYISTAKSGSECWTSDLTAEKGLIQQFVFDKKFEKLLEYHEINPNEFSCGDDYEIGNVTPDFIRSLIQLTKDSYERV